MPDLLPFPPHTFVGWIVVIVLTPILVSSLLGAGLFLQYCLMKKPVDENATPKLNTWVPEDRPRRQAETLHGPVELYAPLGSEIEAQGKRLRDSRFCASLSLGDAARKLGLTVSELSECERGVRGFALADALKILEIPERCVDRRSYIPLPNVEDLERDETR